MGRRSDFKHFDKDSYDTPEAAVLPLLPFLRPTRFIEPCAGAGALVATMERHGHHCVSASDIAPRGPGIAQRDALQLTFSEADGRAVDMIITNPPWTREHLHPLINHLRKLKPTWLLFDAAWAYTQQAAPFLPFCSMIVAVGRVKWIPGTTMMGKDDAAWYKFEAFEAGLTAFVGKQVKRDA